MKNYRPLLLQEIDLRLPGIWIRRLRLNRHLPEVDTVTKHSHRFTQILCYLSGRGTMVVGDVDYEIGPGSTAFLPPKVEHAFRETEGRRPLCLVLDLELRGATKRGLLITRLNLSDSSLIKQELSGLMRLRDPHESADRLLVAAGVLRLLDALFRHLHILQPRQRETTPLVRKVDRLLKQSKELRPDIASLAREVGLQSDYLNRVFKQATGQTLREYRDSLQIARSRQLLGEGLKVGEVCERLGFVDQNYFARWFKKQTGVPPRSYGKITELKR